MSDTDRDAEEQLHEVWVDVRGELDYDYLVDLHWDVSKELLEREEYGGQDDE